jgi:hypothetical protein
MRLVCLAALLVPLAVAEDAREIVRHAMQEDRRNDEIARNYTYLERSNKRWLNPDGSVKREELRTNDVTLCEGTQYRRLVAIDDHPLSADMKKREEEKLRESIEERRKESPEQRAKRIAEWQKKREKNREFLKEFLDAMDFRMTGTGERAGRKYWAIEATPHPGYWPRSMAGKFLAKMRGTLWIDQQDYLPARIEAEATDNVTMGAFIAKVNKGTRFVIDQERVNGEVWLPRRVEASISARVVFSRVRQEFDITYDKFRKFQAESRVVASAP